MIPYVETPALEIGPVTLRAFPLLVVAAVSVGLVIGLRRGARNGFSDDELASLSGWMVVWGFVGAHVFQMAAYAPGRLLSHPLEIFRIWGTLASFGSIAGGLLGVWLMMRRRGFSREKIWRYLELVGFVFPFSLAIGRLGCALAHDHLGLRSQHWLAVRFPDGGRFDLGLLEFFYVSGLCALWLWLDRRPRPTGFFFGTFFLLYGPVRFALDSLRTGDVRYLGWTPGQYAAVAATCAGAAVLLRVVRARR